MCHPIDHMKYEIRHFDESYAENVSLEDGRPVRYGCLGPPRPDEEAALAERILVLTGHRVRFGTWIELEGDPRDGGAEVPLICLD